jgi:hypothetical protein
VLGYSGALKTVFLGGGDNGVGPVGGLEAMPLPTSPMSPLPWTVLEGQGSGAAFPLHQQSYDGAVVDLPKGLGTRYVSIGAYGVGVVSCAINVPSGGGVERGNCTSLHSMGNTPSRPRTHVRGSRTVLVPGGGNGLPRLLITGGTTLTGGPYDLLASSDMWDFGLLVWTHVQMVAARVDHAVVTLPDQRVLVIGGSSAVSDAASAASLASTEIFDPTTSSWTAGPTLSRERRLPEAVLAQDGRVYVVGGRDNAGEAVPAVDILDFRTASLGTVTTMPAFAQPEVGRVHHNLVAVGSCTLAALAGERLDEGQGSIQSSNSVDVLSLGGTLWSFSSSYFGTVPTERDSLTQGLQDAATLRLPSGLVLFTGGRRLFGNNATYRTTYLLQEQL